MANINMSQIPPELGDLLIRGLRMRHGDNPNTPEARTDIQLLESGDETFVTKLQEEATMGTPMTSGLGKGMLWGGMGTWGAGRGGEYLLKKAGPKLAANFLGRAGLGLAGPVGTAGLIGLTAHDLWNFYNAYQRSQYDLPGTKMQAGMAALGSVPTAFEARKLFRKGVPDLGASQTQYQEARDVAAEQVGKPSRPISEQQHFPSSGPVRRRRRTTGGPEPMEATSAQPVEEILQEMGTTSAQRSADEIKAGKAGLASAFQPEVFRRGAALKRRKGLRRRERAGKKEPVGSQFGPTDTGTWTPEGSLGLGPGPRAALDRTLNPQNLASQRFAHQRTGELQTAPDLFPGATGGEASVAGRGIDAATGLPRTAVSGGRTLAGLDEGVLQEAKVRIPFGLESHIDALRGADLPNRPPLSTTQTLQGVEQHVELMDVPRRVKDRLRQEGDLLRESIDDVVQERANQLASFKAKGLTVDPKMQAKIDQAYAVDLDHEVEVYIKRVTRFKNQFVKAFGAEDIRKIQGYWLDTLLEEYDIVAREVTL